MGSWRGRRLPRVSAKSAGGGFRFHWGLGGALTVLVLLAAFSLWGAAAFGHKERPVTFPNRPGSVPTYRTEGPYLVVCTDQTAKLIDGYPEPLRSYNEKLLSECQKSGYSDIQAAVDSVVVPGTRILVQPGRYFETPSLAPPTKECQEIERRAASSPPSPPSTTPGRPLTYEEQAECPHLQNLIAILGGATNANECGGRLCGLQVVGTGLNPSDVIVDGNFQRNNVIRADRADGVYFRNFTVQHGRNSALYIIESNGFAIDQVYARWNTEYGLLTFASDHGLYVNCEAYGNGDSGLYPGGGAYRHDGFSVEITRCKAFHNLLGLAGTGGNYLYIHDNDFSDNSVGIGVDSFFPSHPGLPQHADQIVNNTIHDNNEDFYRYWRNRVCFRKDEAKRNYEGGVVCPQALVPIGTGIMIAGGNSNLVSGNAIYGNDRYGVMLFHNPVLLLKIIDGDLDTSFYNQFSGNSMGRRPNGSEADNGLDDFWWDGEGAGNCWTKNTARGKIRSNLRLPGCSPPPRFTPGNFSLLLALLPCSHWNPTIYGVVDIPRCTWSHEQRPT
jgi:parallel beta helix pectate lyase-like protein